MLASMEHRISRRTYLPIPIEPALTAQIQREIGRVNQISGLRIAFALDASAAFASMRKTYGMFSGVRAALVMKGPAADPNLAEKIGYYGEELVLWLTELGLGTCWVAGTFDREAFPVPEAETMLCVIPVGHVQAPSAKEKLLRSGISHSRKAARERMQNYDQAPQWVKDAMEAVRLAPSAKNTQSPRFCYDAGVITAEGTPSWLGRIDLGIAKRHFALQAGGTFPMGNGAAFLPDAPKEP